MSKPLVITLGDPAGIGPEVLAKTLAVRSAPGARAPAQVPVNQVPVNQVPVNQVPWLIIGSREALLLGAKAAGVRLPELPAYPTLETVLGQPSLAQDQVALMDLGPLPKGFKVGSVQAGCGAQAVQAVELAAEFCLAEQALGMVTCPINKEAIHAAGYVNDIGHQEILARLAGVNATATMLMTPGLRVVHLSTHKSLAQAVAYIQQATVLEKLELTQSTLQRWGLAEPRIAVAGVNPHNGEGGLLGAEEIEQIAPAVAQAREQGIDATGPIPADSVFNRAINGEFDVVLAMYHDQGHIAIKVHDFHHSTTATLGIPFIRTSVDHGTAFDIAGTGKADPTGLQAAIAAADALVAGTLASL